MAFAKRESLNSRDYPRDSSPEKKAFEKLLLNWSAISQELLDALNKNDPYVIEGRSAQSAMALGALGAHLNMALQAHTASDSDLIN